MTTRSHATLYSLGLYFRRQLLARIALGFVLVSPLLSGCEPFRWSKQNANVAWNIRVTSSDTPGQYAIAGQADLPDRTPLTIIAVRYLHSSDANSVALNADPTYSILAYSPSEVVGGQWQTKLNLWQVAPNGNYQEAWQLEQRRLNLTLKPDADVVFLALLSPISALPKLERSLEKEGLQLPEQTLRTTLDGERFAQVNQSLEVALPSGKTDPTIPALDDRNDGWGSRYLIPKEPQNPIELTLPETRQTDAPPRTAEFLR